MESEQREKNGLLGFVTTYRLLAVCVGSGKIQQIRFNYEREFRDILSLQGELAQAIANELQTK
jgi:hypothetical protein